MMNSHTPNYQRQMIAAIAKANKKRLAYNEGDNAYDGFVLNEETGKWEKMVWELTAEEAAEWYSNPA